ncbi:MAG: pyridoxine 5'-phosphate synthase, partial [Desulfovibrionales bacterium]
LLKQTVQTRLHLEMAATGEMQRIALETRPFLVCLVPEKRQELTTEGGLNLVGREEELSDFLAPLHEAGIRSSLFIDADKQQIDAARRINAEYIELHTGHYADAPAGKEQNKELQAILHSIEYARQADLKVNLGHGLNYTNIQAFSRTPGIHEYSIGHSIISRAVFTGMKNAVSDMAAIISGFPS